MPAAPAAALAPVGPERFRADIRAVRSLLPTISDRGAAQFFLAWLYAHLKDYDETLTLLKECALDEGFDPSVLSASSRWNRILNSAS